MPLRHQDAFTDPTTIPDRGINPYLAKVKTLAAEGPIKPFYGDRLKNVAGNWRSALSLGSSSRLFLEIGCYKGLTLAQASKSDPEAYFVGIDITFKRIVMTAEKLQQEQCTNASPAMVRVSEKTIGQVFGSDELDAVMIFFPDPWTRNSQRKNRLMNPAFTTALRNCIKPGGKLWFKTDQLDYFKETTIFLENDGFILTEDLSLFGDTDQFITPFQARFTEKSLPTYSGIWQKNLVH